VGRAGYLDKGVADEADELLVADQVQEVHGCAGRRGVLRRCASHRRVP
jgi:hypothetical protein